MLVPCSLSLLLLVGCAKAPAGPVVGPSGAVMPAPTAHGPARLTESEEALWSAIRAMTGMARGKADASKRRVASTAAVDGFYTGPFPAAGALPAGYEPRPSRGVSDANPSVATEGGTTTTETYWTPNGDNHSPAAYTKVVTTNGVTTLDLYASPPAPVPALPAFFKERVAPGREVEQAAETYQVYQKGPLTGTAVGYRWSVFGPGRRLTAWIRAFEVVGADGSRVDCYEIFSDYQSVDGTIRPTRYAYGTYKVDSQAGLALEQVLDPATGVWTSQGSWQDLAADQAITFTETIQPGGAVHRDLVFSPDDTLRVKIAEDYAPDQAGTAVIYADGEARASGSWPTSGLGSVTFNSGSSRPYQPSRFRFSTGALLETFALDAAPVGIALDMEGRIWSVAEELLTVRSLAGEVLDTFELDREPSDLATDPAGGIWVASRRGGGKKCWDPPGLNLGHYKNGKAPCAQPMIARFSHQGQWLFEFEMADEPDALAVDAKGQLWVASTGANRIAKFSPQGEALGAFEVGEGPVALSVDRDGHVWVANSGSQDVVRLAPDGTQVGRFALGTTPVAICAIPSGGAWVASANARQAIRLAASGRVAGTFASDASPRDLAADAFGNAWVSFGSAARIEVLAR